MRRKKHDRTAHVQELRAEVFMAHASTRARAHKLRIRTPQTNHTRTIWKFATHTHIGSKIERHTHTHMLPTERGHVTLAWHRIYRECKNVLPFRAPAGILHHIWVLCYRHSQHTLFVCGYVWLRNVPPIDGELMTKNAARKVAQTHSWNSSRVVELCAGFVWPAYTTVTGQVGTASITICKRGWLYV